MVVDVPLNGKEGKELTMDIAVTVGGLQPEDRVQAMGEGDDPFPELSAFLKRHPTAKIVLIIDTHCLRETGLFVWGGHDAASYQACSLLSVSYF